MKLSGVLAGMSALVLCMSCSIKEDRGACPCRVIMDFSGVDTSAVSFLNILAETPDGFVYKDVISQDEFGKGKEIEVPRTDVCINVYSGVDESYLSGDGMLIPYGEESPPVYVHAVLLDTRREWLREHVEMKKSHCVMTVRVRNDSGFPYDISIRGNVNGLDRMGDPRDGDFQYMLPGTAEEGFIAIIPRQKDSSLRLYVSESGGADRAFALGEYLQASGYDWSKDELEDVTVWLDYSMTHLSLVIRMWDGSYKYDIVI